MAAWLEELLGELERRNKFGAWLEELVSGTSGCASSVVSVNIGMQLLIHIRCLETLGVTSCLCNRLLIALKDPPCVGKKK